METLGFSLTPNQTLCISCMKPTEKSFTHTGRMYVGVRFIEKEVEKDLVFNGTEFEEVEVRTKKIPCGQWRKGNICHDCYLEHGLKTRDIKHRDGSVSWEPIIKLDDRKVWERNRLGFMVQRASYQTTLNPGWSRDDQMSQVERKVDYLGFLEDEEVDRACYTAFHK